MELKRKRLTAVFTLHALIFGAGFMLAMIGFTANIAAISDLGVLIALVHVLTFRLIPLDRLFQEWRVQLFICFVCKLEIDMLEHWRCNCGYTADRHLFSPCPQCGKGFAWLACPRCGTSHLI